MVNRAFLRRVSQSLVYRAPGERHDCPACASPWILNLDVLPLRAARTGFVCCCESCGLVFSNPLPTAAALEQFYSPSGDWNADRREAGNEPMTAPEHAGGSWARLFDPVRGVLDVTAPPRGSRVLDFGCGDGKLLDQLQKCGWETFGIEPATDRAFGRHRRLDAVPDVATFDLVVLIQVLEHMPNPLQLLTQLARACHVGGHLLVSVPRFDTLPQHRDYRYVLNGRAHITGYTWACIRTLLARAGWEPVAPPPAEVGKGGGGRQTRSRLRVMARRSEGTLPEAERPAEDARTAVRSYYEAGDTRPLLARAGWLRLSARLEDGRRKRAKAARKAANRRMTSEARGI